MRDTTRECVHAVSAIAGGALLGALIGIVIGSFVGCSEGVRAPTPLERELARNATSENISARLQSHRSKFDSCHRIYGPGVDGVIVMKFRIGTDGVPTRPHAFEDIGQSSRFDRCLVETVRGLRFGPLPPGVFADVSYPLIFRDNRRAPASALTGRDSASQPPQPE